MITLKQLIKKPNPLASGHRTCRGCTAIPEIVRTILRASDKPVVIANATGCLEVTTTIYPQTAWNIPWIHSTFESTAAVISGVESAHKVLKKKNKNIKDINFIAFAGDGGAYDIGLQSLSGMLERGHNCLFVCYDNEAYMNTGIQRSSATPYGASTTTTPDGKIHHGKERFRKNLTKIAIAHDIPYVAQAAVSHWQDLYAKAEKAFKIKGPKFINILAPCTLGWGFPENMGIEISRLGVETNFWPLYENENNQYKINYKPTKQKPIQEFLKHQKRYKHLFKPKNKHIIEKIQKHVNEEWKKLLKNIKY